MLVLTTFVSSALILATAPAQAPAAPSSPRSMEPRAGDEERTCGRFVATGSQVKKRRCLTRAQWARYEAARRAELRAADASGGRF